jgi:hypothetical protein
MRDFMFMEPRAVNLNKTKCNIHLQNESLLEQSHYFANCVVVFSYFMEDHYAHGCLKNVLNFGFNQKVSCHYL